MTGNRRAVVLALLGSAYLALLPVGVFAPGTVNPLLAERGSVAALLSMVILLVSILVVSYAILAVDPQFIDGATPGVSHVLLFTGVAYTVALEPFAVLTAYVFRVAAVARKTLSAGPFILGRDGEGPLDYARLRYSS